MTEDSSCSNSSKSETPLEAELLNACFKGDNDRIKSLLRQDATIWCTDETGRTPLHFAAASGSVSTVRAVLEAGIPWNSLDVGGYTAGDYAEQGDHSDVYNELVDAGVRAEMVLSLVNSGKRAVPNEDYLSNPIEYSGDRLIDAQRNGVMMEWEEPLMREHAKLICPEPGRAVLNVGFGMGIIDEALQELKPRRHVIVEAHPDVHKHMLSQGWDKKPGVTIVFGRWQDKLDEICRLGPFDGIFFDTFGEFYQDLAEFHRAILSTPSKSPSPAGGEPILARPGGVYSFFNGLGGDHKLFHDVYCRIVTLELGRLGLDVDYTPIVTDSVINPELWKGIKRPYWMLKQYNLPICTWRT